VDFQVFSLFNQLCTHILLTAKITHQSHTHTGGHNMNYAEQLQKRNCKGEQI